MPERVLILAPRGRDATIAGELLGRDERQPFRRHARSFSKIAVEVRLPPRNERNFHPPRVRLATAIEEDLDAGGHGGGVLSGLVAAGT